jgi:Concanavalin A-like lectin/glucanases superfamily
VHAGSETRLYIDGVLVRYKNAQFPIGQGVVRSTLIIGRARRYADSRVTHHFDGLVDEAMIYDRALTAAEVATLARRCVLPTANTRGARHPGLPRSPASRRASLQRRRALRCHPISNVGSRPPESSRG